MIKANELRIGNLVYCKSYKGDFYEVSVESIIEKGINISVKNDNDWTNELDFDEAFPIPLTPDWLERLGFEAMDIVSWQGNGADYQPDDCGTILKDYVNGQAIFRFKEWYFTAGGVRHSEYSTSVLLTEWYTKTFEGEVPGRTPEYVHQLQNLFFVLTGEELIVKEANYVPNL